MLKTRINQLEKKDWLLYTDIKCSFPNDMTNQVPLLMTRERQILLWLNFKPCTKLRAGFSPFKAWLTEISVKKNPKYLFAFNESYENKH